MRTGLQGALGVRTELQGGWPGVVTGLQGGTAGVVTGLQGGTAGLGTGQQGGWSGVGTGLQGAGGGDRARAIFLIFPIAGYLLIIMGRGGWLQL